MEPAPAFNYALFAEDDLEVKNNEVIIGSMYSTGDVTIKNNTIVCGGIKAAGGDITMESNSELVSSLAGTDCTDQDADAWAGGSILQRGHDQRQREGVGTHGDGVQRIVARLPDRGWHGGRHGDGVRPGDVDGRPHVPRHELDATHLRVVARVHLRPRRTIRR